tara:strand:- start:5221 stop:5475 length:255 start_codon:yes stop_codon:yes gene_type:complete
MDMEKEPERYYDWMLWKMRQDKVRSENLKSNEIDRTSKLGEGISTSDKVLTREINKIKKQVNKIDKNLEELLDAIVQLQKQKDG